MRKPTVLQYRDNVQIQQADVPNKNNRVYAGGMLAVVCDHLRESRRPVCGTIGMPQGKDTLKVRMSEASHLVENLRLEGGWVVGNVTVLDTERGRALAEMLKDRPVDFRVAGVGDTVLRPDGAVEVTDFKLMSINAVEDGA